MKKTSLLLFMLYWAFSNIYAVCDPPVVTSITTNTGGNMLNCNISTISLIATGGDSYIWSTGEITPDITVSSAGTYAVTVTNNDGCTATSDITIMYDITPPPASITTNPGASMLGCNNEVSLTATGGIDYLWSNGATNSGINVDTPGIYAVTVTGANGCTTTSNITIAEDMTPPVAGIINNTGTNTLDCYTPEISLTATGGDTYLWSNGATSTDINVTFAGIYSVTVTGANGCTTTSNITIAEDMTPPDADIVTSTGTTVLNCYTPEISLTATGGDTYLWSTGESASDIMVSSAGTYTVTVTGANGCTATSNITITEDDIPTAVITTSTGTTVLNCHTSSISLTATGGDSYMWSTGAITANMDVTAPGTYSVTVTDNYGCSATSNITIAEDMTPPDADIVNNTGTSTLDCYTPEISLTATGGDSYLWSNGANTTDIDVTFAGIYSVTVTGANGCTATSNITIGDKSSAPNIKITYPSLSSMILSDKLDIQFDICNFPVGENAGKIKYTLDENRANYQTTTDDIKLTGLQNGAHTLSLELVNNDEASLDPPVITSVDFTVDSPQGMGQSNRDNIRIYPNPAKDIVYIDMDSFVTLIAIRDLAGQLVYQTKPDALKQKIQVEGLPSGIYFISVTAQDEVKTFKLIVE